MIILITVMTNHDRVWRHSDRIAKVVDRQRWRTSFREHTTTYVHTVLSSTSSVLTPYPCPRSSLRHVTGPFPVSPVPTLTGEVVIRYDPVTGRYRITSRVHRPVTCLIPLTHLHSGPLVFCAVQPPQSSCLILHDHMAIVYLTAAE